MLKSFRRFVRMSLKKVLPSPLQEALRGRYYVHWVVPHLSDKNEPDLVVVRAFLRPGDAAVDAGANFGWYSTAMAACVGPDGRIFAIEPVPTTYRLLEQVVKGRGFGVVRCVNVAVSDGKGVAEMTIPEMDDGFNYYRASLDRSEARGNKVSVETDTLDDLCAKLGKAPVLVKMDLEGHERTALAGASQLLKARAAWLLELPDDPDDQDSDAAAIDTLMKSYGYVGWWYDVATSVLRQRGRGVKPVNLFYFTDDHLERLRNAPFDIESANPDVPQSVNM